MSKTDVILIGGGLANGLIAYRLATSRPDLSIRLLEASPTLGGNHTWSFHHNDLDTEQRAWLSPFICSEWHGHDVRFRTGPRALPSAYYSITSDRLRTILSDALPGSILTEAEVSEVTPTGVTLRDGRLFDADAVIDGRGQKPSRHIRLGHQKFVGQELQLKKDHGMTRPVIMDADVPQVGGYRFVYTLPFKADQILIEDTYYADEQTLDRDAVADRIAAYAREKGWEIESVIREESGVLPIILDGDVTAYWQDLPDGIPAVGLRGGFFHPTTGYSLPDAVRNADLVAALPDLTSAALYDLLRGRAIQQWKDQGFYRMLNRMLFLAAEPAARHKIMARFYSLRAGLIDRFYAGQNTLPDKMRILTGRPPVSIFSALRVIRANQPVKQTRGAQA